MSDSNSGRVADGEQALVNEAPAGLHPPGFDPSRTWVTAVTMHTCIDREIEIITHLSVALSCGADEALEATKAEALTEYPDHTIGAWVQQSLASAIEAQRGETAGLGAQHESAVPQADAKALIA